MFFICDLSEYTVTFQEVSKIWRWDERSWHGMIGENSVERFLFNEACDRRGTCSTHNRHDICQLFRSNSGWIIVMSSDDTFLVGDLVKNLTVKWCHISDSYICSTYPLLDLWLYRVVKDPPFVNELYTLPLNQDLEITYQSANWWMHSSMNCLYIFFVHSLDHLGGSLLGRCPTYSGPLQLQECHCRHCKRCQQCQQCLDDRPKLPQNEK